ncbi:DUF1000-domain-containing protein [Trichodelitschia bisporula]|uniref:DUF1000-domain-containing protein n=1 Tax=Trichodelitschia bisporula TaxID=703511 RepID=A0A6G1HTZ4_9PEZI|nr:DUF1000-domain-containing protein [Trichodelitschia bisporula]
MPCEHEHDGHGHGDECDHGPTDELAHQKLLYQEIDFDSVRCQGGESNNAKAVVKKTYAERLSTEPTLTSACDAEMLVTVPYVPLPAVTELCSLFHRFTGQVRLHSILIRTSDSDNAPSTLKVFVNMDQLELSDVADKKPTQTFELPRTNAVQELPIKRVFFSRATSLSFFFADNHSGDDEEPTTISWLAFKGDYMPLNRKPISVTYEAFANPATADKIPGIANGLGQIGD